MEKENDYLKILYQDFSTKINSIREYLKRLNAAIDEINTNAFEMTAKLRKKYTAMDTFKKSRPSVTTNSGFSTENRNPLPQNISQDNIEELDISISNSAEKLNHFFIKTEDDTRFLKQSLNGLQDILNNIYDTFGELMKG